MSVNNRTTAILNRISQSSMPVSGSTLAKEFGVSRQIIVKDISALKNEGNDIIATTKGYILHKPPMPKRIFKVVHKDDEIAKELTDIVDVGGIIEDVFVWHKIYGKIEAKLDIKSHDDVKEYLITLKNGRSSPLKNVTNQYHYHTIKAENELILNKVENVLKSAGFLVIDE